MTSPPPPRFFFLTSSDDILLSSRPGVLRGARLVDGLHCVASVHASFKTALIFRPLARSRAVSPLSSVRVTSAPCFKREQAARSWSLYACKENISTSFQKVINLREKKTFQTLILPWVIILCWAEVGKSQQIFHPYMPPCLHASGADKKVK